MSKTRKPPSSVRKQANVENKTVTLIPAKLGL
jgi:hypothetical protein